MLAIVYLFVVDFNAVDFNAVDKSKLLMGLNVISYLFGYSFLVVCYVQSISGVLKYVTLKDVNKSKFDKPV